MPELTFNEAVEYLFGAKKGDETFKHYRKQLDNYTKIGEEIKYDLIRKRYYIRTEELDRWRELKSYRTVWLDRNDYLRCFEFAVKSFYQYLESGSTADFLGARERGIGKWAEDFLPGKLGEIAVKKFLNEKFAVDIKLDFSLGEGIPAQDIVEVAKPRKGPRTYNPARIRTSIKNTKMKNVWLVVTQKEFEDMTRRSDAYILTRSDMPLNHLASFLKEHEVFARLGEIIPHFKNIEAEVVGFAWSGDFKFYREGVPGTPIERPHYGLPSGKLRHARNEWEEYIKRL